MFCTNCGKEVEGKFCTNCGAQILFDADPAQESTAKSAVPETSFIPEPIQSDAPTQGQAPVYAPPVAPEAPVVAAPAAPADAQPPKQKKRLGAGKIILIVLGGILTLIILAVAGCALFINNAIDKAEDYSSAINDAFESAVVTTPEALPSAEVELPAETEKNNNDGEYVYYEGLLYLTVDEARYEGSNLVADVTLWNECEFGIGNIKDLMVALYDVNDNFIASGNFFFDGAYESDVIESEDYTELTLTFENAEPDMDLSDVSASFELMCRMYDEDENVLGQRVETRLFTICLPEDYIGTVDYYTTDTAYCFFHTSNRAGGYDGLLFSIEYYESEDEAPADAEFIGSDAYYYYYVTYPTDAQYDASVAKLAEEYENLQSQIDRAIYTINIF